MDTSDCNRGKVGDSEYNVWHILYLYKCMKFPDIPPVLDVHMSFN